MGYLSFLNLKHVHNVSTLYRKLFVMSIFKLTSQGSFKGSCCILFYATHHQVDLFCWVQVNQVFYWGWVGGSIWKLVIWIIVVVVSMGWCIGNKHCESNFRIIVPWNFCCPMVQSSQDILLNTCAIPILVLYTTLLLYNKIYTPNIIWKHHQREVTKWFRIYKQDTLLSLKYTFIQQLGPLWNKSSQPTLNHISWLTQYVIVSKSGSR